MIFRPFGRSTAVLLVPLVAVGLLISPRTVTGQASNYPSLQIPTASFRDYTGAIASGAGTSLIFQWREGIGQGMHLGLDAGFTDRRGSENLLAFLGGSIGSELLRAQGEQPLDLLLTGGFGLAFGGGASIFRIPLGASVGHTFNLEQGMSVTPYVHPRASIDICSNCGRSGRRRSEVSLNFDIGMNFQVTKVFGVRGTAGFSGSDFFGDYDTFAIGATWTPAPIKR